MATIQAQQPAEEAEERLGYSSNQPARKFQRTFSSGVSQGKEVNRNVVCMSFRDDLKRFCVNDLLFIVQTFI